MLNYLIAIILIILIISRFRKLLHKRGVKAFVYDIEIFKSTQQAIVYANKVDRKEEALTANIVEAEDAITKTKKEVDSDKEEIVLENEEESFVKTDF